MNSFDKSREVYRWENDTGLTTAIKWASLIGILEILFYTDILKFHTGFFILENILYYLRGILQYNAKNGIFFYAYFLLLVILSEKIYLSKKIDNTCSPKVNYLPHLFFIGFLLYIVLNTLLNHSTAFVIHNKLAIMAYTLPVMIGAVILASEVWVERLFKSFVITGIIVIFNIVVNHNTLLSGIAVYSRLVVNSDTITSGRLLWFNVICGILYLELIKSYVNKILFLLFYIFPSIIFAFMTGSRGPAIAFMLTFLLYLSFSGFKFSKKNWLIIITFALAFAGLYILDNTAADIAARFTTGDSIRGSYYSSAINIHPSMFGVGMGNSYQFLSFNQFDYIHNIVLEAYVELGIFGLAIFGGWVFLVLQRLIIICRETNNVAYKFILCGFIFNFIGAMFSGNLLTQKEVYFFTILALGIERTNAG